MENGFEQQFLGSNSFKVQVLNILKDKLWRVKSEREQTLIKELIEEISQL